MDAGHRGHTPQVAAGARARLACLVETACLYASIWVVGDAALHLWAKAGLFEWSNNAWPLWRTHDYLGLPYLLAAIVSMAVVPLAWERAVRKTPWSQIGFVLPARALRDIAWAVGLLGAFIAYAYLLSQRLNIPCRFTGRFEWMVVVGWLVMAVSEECVYRAVLQRRLGKVLGNWGGLVAAALLFAFLGHTWAPWEHNLALRVPFGLLLGYLYLHSGSVLLPIGAHWLFNILLTG